jgi:hypothetical protein
MLHKSSNIRVLARLLSLLTIAALLLPTGLNAKSALEFCMMNMHDHHAMEMSGEMHDCCNAEPDDDAHCPEMSYCTCSVEDTGETEPFRVLQSSVKLTVTPNPFLEPPVLPDDRIDRHRQMDADEHHPPLYLLYDTFLN